MPHAHGYLRSPDLTPGEWSGQTVERAEYPAKIVCMRMTRIEGYLNELNHVTFLKIETLMFFGREGGNLESVDFYLADLEESKEET